jgi:hypothetical protein
MILPFALAKGSWMPTREIARRMGTAPSTVRLTIRRFSVFELSKHPQDDRPQLWQVNDGGFP